MTHDSEIVLVELPADLEVAARQASRRAGVPLAGTASQKPSSRKLQLAIWATSPWNRSPDIAV